MAYTLFFVILTLFSIIGLVEIIKNLIFRMYRNSDDRTIILITPLKGHSENLEYTLRHCAAKVKWSGRSSPERIICLDNGIDEEDKKICRYLCEEYEYMDIMNPRQLYMLLTENENPQ